MLPKKGLLKKLFTPEIFDEIYEIKKEIKGHYHYNLEMLTTGTH